MENLKIVDSENNISNIVYLYSGLTEVLSGTARNFSSYSDGTRSVLEIDVCDGYSDLIKTEIEDKIADIIAVNYKYNFLSERIHPIGLSLEEKEILISSLISADIDDDRFYIKSKIESNREYSIDGLFNFRLSKLKNKWHEVSLFIPKTFSSDKLKDFIAFLFEEKRGIRVFVENGKVFDRHFRRMNRTFLTGKDYGEAKLLNEILLSGCGEAELLSVVSEKDEDYLKEYLGSKIIFNKTYFC